MGSEEGSECQQQQFESPKLCVNGCGFFGSAATMNLCSKCFRDSRMEEERAASVKAAIEKSHDFVNGASVESSSSTLVVASKKPQSIVDEATTETSSSGLGVGGAQPNSVVKNRCSTCNKRVGLTGFKCRCESTFCSAHRYPEEHECPFNFKSVGREAIAKANPLVKADKLDKI